MGTRGRWQVTMALLFLTLLACSPITPYRSSLGVPTVAPPTAVGAPIAAGTLGVGGWIGVHPLAGPDLDPQLGDPGLWASPSDMGGFARVGIAGALELGVAGEYARGESMMHSATGVFEIPGDDSVWGGSVWLTGGWMWGKVGFGGTLEATRMSMPYARFAYTGPEEYLDHGVYIGDGAEDLYTLYETGRVHPIRVRTSGQFQYRHKGVEVAAGMAVTPTFTNKGFSIEQAPIYLAGGIAMGPVVDLGYDFGVARLGGQAWMLAGGYGASGGLDPGYGMRFTAEVRPFSAKKTFAPAPPPPTESTTWHDPP